MARNATLLHYPIRESIASALPIVDELVVALGAGDPGDTTREEIESIGSPKITIIDTVWDIDAFPRGMEHAHQTDIAKEACRGEWLLYLQADEVLHEDDLPKIVARCAELRNDREVEGLLFDYLHFWGDYDHHHRSHGWYKHEIRIVRNDPEIHSWESAQSFRRIPDFDGRSYRVREGTRKLNVASVDARIFHYGWVRPPRAMQRKHHAFETNHLGRRDADQRHAERAEMYDYGPLGRLPLYKGTHPSVMADRIAAFDWGDDLDYSSDPPRAGRPLHKHERLKYRLLTMLEEKLVGGRELGGFHNYHLLTK